MTLKYVDSFNCCKFCILITVERASKQTLMIISAVESTSLLLAKEMAKLMVNKKGNMT